MCAAEPLAGANVEPWLRGGSERSRRAQSHHTADKLMMPGHRQPRQLILKVEGFDDASTGLQHQNVTNASGIQLALGIQSVTTPAGVLI